MLRSNKLLVLLLILLAVLTLLVLLFLALVFSVVVEMSIIVNRHGIKGLVDKSSFIRRHLSSISLSSIPSSSSPSSLSSLSSSSSTPSSSSLSSIPSSSIPSTSYQRFQNDDKPSFHKRPLPENLISLSSIQGKKLFKEALELGGMESFFALSEQFVTQSEPSFCALSSLAMVLNALNFDPKKTWKGSWRWVSEETLQCETTEICGHSLDKVKRDGMDFNEFESLARCHSVGIQSQRLRDGLKSHINPIELNEFRDRIIKISSSANSDAFIVVNFSRRHLGQTGDGHFSPIGGYHSEKDLVLIMDVARFKYPPFWCSLTSLWDSMTIKDEKTKQSRGYFLVFNQDNGNIRLDTNDKFHTHDHDHNHDHSHSHDHHHGCSHTFKK